MGKQIGFAFINVNKSSTICGPVWLKATDQSESAQFLYE